ncbi:MAG: alpha/beta hydrolase, partial [Acidimicrobiia bacterium]|nr:alpha/beta hydrolase [Acidimicrobiia bacterium]
AHIVGHDFGGAVAWGLGMFASDRIDRMVVMASPHPMRLHEAAAGDPEQIQRSFYVWLMHAGASGERLLAADDFRLLAAWAFASRIPAELVDAYREEWARPGAFRAMAEWYRANYPPDLFNPDVEFDLPPVRVPVRYLHPERDPAFVSGVSTGSGKFVDAEFDEGVVAGTSHWLVHEEPEVVAGLIDGWLSGG